jgi:DNA-directed RNA polymerase sigma subunit (sigma70/sigma32)
MKTTWEMLTEPIMHDTERKRRALAWIESRQATCTHEEVAEKYNLEKRVIKQGKPGHLTKYGYFAGDQLVLDKWDK